MKIPRTKDALTIRATLVAISHFPALLPAFGDPNGLPVNPGFVWNFQNSVGEIMPIETNDVFATEEAAFNGRLNLFSKMVIGLRGRGFSDTDPAEDFDLDALLGTDCLLNYVRERTPEGTEALVLAGVTRLKTPAATVPAPVAKK